MAGVQGLAGGVEGGISKLLQVKESWTGVKPLSYWCAEAVV